MVIEEKGLTWGQKYFWDSYLKLALEDQWTKNSMMDIPVPEDTSVERVLACLKVLIRRHEGLRTHYGVDGTGSPVQKVRSEFTIPLKVEVVGSREEAVAFSGRLCREGFRITEEPPVRAGVVVDSRLPDRARRLFLVLHHIVADWFAQGIVRSEVEWLLGGGPEGALALPVQPRDLMEYESSQVGLRKRDRSTEYWRSLIPTFPRTAFPVPAVVVEPGTAMEAVFASSEMTRSCRRVSRTQGVSVPACLLACYALALSAYVGNDHVGIAVSSANRHRRAGLSALANMMQSLPVRLDVRGTHNFSDLLHRARECETQVLRYGLFDPDHAADATRDVLERRGLDLDAIPGFNCLSHGGGRPSQGSAPFEEHTITRLGGRLRHVLQMRCRSDAGILRTSLRYNAEVLPGEDVEAFLRGMARILTVYERSPEVGLEELIDLAGLPVLSRGPGWFRSEGCWVSTAQTEEMIQRIPEITKASVREEGGLVQALVSTSEPVPEERFRRLLHAQVRNHPASVVPDRFSFCE